MASIIANEGITTTTRNSCTHLNEVQCPLVTSLLRNHKQPAEAISLNTLKENERGGGEEEGEGEGEETLLAAPR